jgi:hypothetical protein
MVNFYAFIKGSAAHLTHFVFRLLALAPLLAHAATPVLTLQATVPTGSTDVTAFVDKVEVANAGTGAVVASALSNGSFETFTSLSSVTYGYSPGASGHLPASTASRPAAALSATPPPRPAAATSHFCKQTAAEPALSPKP